MNAKRDAKSSDTEPVDPQPVLERQRAEHQDHPAGVDPAESVDDTGIGKLVNNTGQDGDAATG